MLVARHVITWVVLPVPVAATLPTMVSVSSVDLLALLPNHVLAQLTPTVFAQTAKLSVAHVLPVLFPLVLNVLPGLVLMECANLVVSLVPLELTNLNLAMVTRIVFVLLVWPPLDVLLALPPGVSHYNAPLMENTSMEQNAVPVT